jgi:Tfp pilus assembly protein PilO
MAVNASMKRLMIDKANSMMVVVIGFAAFVTVFSLVSIKALWGQSGYQNRVINKKEKAVKQLQANIAASNQLEDSFKKFDQSPSMLANKDNNAKIVLDALPSKYDFPALTTSLEKMLLDGGFKISGISGIDDEASQDSSVAGATKPVEIPFALEADANYTSVQNFLKDIDRSIRPFTLTALDLSGNNNDIRIGLQAKSYYQPEKGVTITTETVK